MRFIRGRRRGRSPKRANWSVWLRDLFGTEYPTLVQEAAAAGVGAGGILMLPYFAGERTPVQDPDARGTIVGLTLSSTRGDLYRAALEATAGYDPYDPRQTRTVPEHLDVLSGLADGVSGLRIGVLQEGFEDADVEVTDLVIDV